MRLITVCVEYDDLLLSTLPGFVRHFDKVLVITAPQDDRTKAVVARFGADLFVTDAFYRRGTKFNKGLALEEGFDALGRSGWIAVVDADVVLPSKINFGPIRSGFLYSPKRRMYEGIVPPPEESWGVLELNPEQELPGYFQLFHADDAVLRERPWYAVNWVHAGGCDSDFQGKWPLSRHKLLPFEVLHLGEAGVNWQGRCTRRVDGSMPVGYEERKALQSEIQEARARDNHRILRWEKL